MVRATVLSQVQAMIWRVSEGSARKGSFGSPMDPAEIISLFQGMLDADAEAWGQSRGRGVTIATLERVFRGTVNKRLTGLQRTCFCRHSVLRLVTFCYGRAHLPLRYVTI